MTDTADIVAAPAPGVNTRRFALRLITWFVCAIVIGCVVYALVKQFRALDWSQLHFAAAPALAAVACLFAVSAMQLVARWTLLIAYGYPLSWRIQLPAAWVPQLGKYVPGGIASVGGAVILLRKHGVPAAIGLTVALLLDALAVMAGLIVSTPLLLWEPIRQRWPHAWIACVILTVGGLVMLHPRVFVWLLNLLLKRIRRQPITQVPPIARYLWPVIASFGQWVFAGFALWFMTGAVTPVTIQLVPLFIACAALAMTVSYLMPFAPGGLGIREALYLVTLGPVIGAKIAVVVVAMRIVQTLIEVLLALVGAALLRKVTPAE